VTIDAVHFVAFYISALEILLVSYLDWAVFYIPANKVYVIWEVVVTGQKTQPTVSKYWRNIVNRQIKHTISTHIEHKTQQVPYSTLIWGD